MPLKYDLFSKFPSRTVPLCERQDIVFWHDIGSNYRRRSAFSPTSHDVLSCLWERACRGNSNQPGFSSQRPVELKLSIKQSLTSWFISSNFIVNLIYISIDFVLAVNRWSLRLWRRYTAANRITGTHLLPKMRTPSVMMSCLVRSLTGLDAAHRVVSLSFQHKPPCLCSHAHLWGLCDGATS